jgi:hypothetical protein
LGKSVTKVAALLFPPNWSACVSGPHLAAPLLASVAKARFWEAYCLDLSAEFYSQFACAPSRADLTAASAAGDFDRLDEIYFGWEDELRRVGNELARTPFALLSGFDFSALSGEPLSEVEAFLRLRGTLFDQFYHNSVVPRLLASGAAVIGVTIASHHQIIPALRLLQIIRDEMPGALLVLGGNIITRLRQTTAFDVFRRLADQIVVYQGELAFERTLDMVETLGVRRARRELSSVAGDERIPHNKWPVPIFDGIDFDDIVGVPTLSYVSTRGCYWGRCSFCAIPAGWASGGYAGTAPAEFVFEQLQRMTSDTGVPRIKFVDEAIAPSKVRKLSALLAARRHIIEWEAYARLEPAWESPELLELAHAGGLRKLYFGLEQAPTTDRSILNKNDAGDIGRIMEACNTAGVKVHLFCMVGHPYSTVDDAWATTRFLIDHQELVDTADLVGFRLDRGTSVAGVRPQPNPRCDWETSLRFERENGSVLCLEQVNELEIMCQEALWEAVPRLLHPLYRIVGPWHTLKPVSNEAFGTLAMEEIVAP